MCVARGHPAFCANALIVLVRSLHLSLSATLSVYCRTCSRWIEVFKTISGCLWTLSPLDPSMVRLDQGYGRGYTPYLESSHGKGCTQKSLSSSHEELNISPEKWLRKKFLRKTRPSFYALVQKKKYSGENSSLTGSSSHDDLNRPGTFWRRKSNAYRGMTLSLVCLSQSHDWLCSSRMKMDRQLFSGSLDYHCIADRFRQHIIRRKRKISKE